MQGTDTSLARYVVINIEGPSKRDRVVAINDFRE
jgi:hypothetical protein